ncbi:MAG: glycosyltransferase family 4 protein [Vicinamibacterales bacterium]
MRIGIDAREICGQSTGVGRWLGMLLREWLSAVPPLSHELILYAPEAVSLPTSASPVTQRIVPGGRGTVWEQMALPRAAAKDALDVFFAPAYTAPLQLKAPAVALIHDVSFTAHPEWFTPREGVRRRLLTERTAHMACAVVTVSEFSRREIVDLLGVDAGKVHVVLPGIEPLPLPASAREAREPRVLYVGSIFNRRRIPALIRAFGGVALRHRRASLDIVGDNRTYPFQDVRQCIAHEELDDRVRWHQYVTDDQLAGLYHSARAFAFLSEYEGLGMTPLEALASGVPPLLLDTAVARESCGDAALYVPPDDTRAAGDCLDRLLFDEATRGQVLSAAPGTLGRYSWPRAAREVMSLLEGCATR